MTPLRHTRLIYIDGYVDICYLPALGTLSQYVGYIYFFSQEVEATSSKLDAAMDDLESHIDTLSGENNDLRPLVDDATDHALKLQRQAEMLDK